MTEPKTELQRNALAEARRVELDTFQRALDVKWLNSRMEDGRMGRLLGLLQRESDMEKQYHERTDHAAIVNKRAETETNLASEIVKVRQEEATELQRRHYLRERDPQLRQLVRKLEAGYTCRDLKQQILNNEYRRLQAQADEKQANQLLLKALDHNGEIEREAREKVEREAEYRRELQQQLVNRNRVKQCQYEDTLIEKKMLDEIMRTISEEDKRELEQKRRTTEKMRQEMKTFQQARMAWRDKQKMMVINEERQIEDQRKMHSDRHQAVIDERNRILRAREDANRKIAAQIRAQEEEKQRREDIINLLKEQEYLEKNIQDDIEEKAKRARVKNETKEALNALMAMKKQLADEQAVRDWEIRKHTEAKAIEDELKEQEKRRLLREKNRKYAAELLQQAEDHRAMGAANKRDEESRAKAVMEYNASWNKETAKERQQIIQEHAPHVLGYLQAGVLTKEDLPDVRIGADRHQALANMNIEDMARTKRPKRFAKCNAQCRVIREY